MAANALGSQKMRLVASILVVLVLAIAANFRALHCFFFADDFLCFDYLYRAFHGEPGLFVERLVSPWQDRSISLFYRPVCDLILFSTYALWRENPLAYHMVNLILHLFASVLVFFFVRLLCKELDLHRAELAALLSASCFAAYPLHVEPVVWTCCAADLASAIFLMLSLIFVIKSWRAGTSPASMFLPGLFYFLALLSKEASAAGFFLLIAHLCFFSKQKAGWKNLFLQMSPFIAFTLAYFVLRYIVLGTFLGGYSASIGDAFMDRFMGYSLAFDSFAMLALGINLFLFSAQSPEVLILKGIYFLLAAIMLIRALFFPWGKRSSKLLLLLGLSSVFSLLPCLQVIGLTGALSNSRIFYLPSLFYIPLIVLSVVPLEKESAYRERHTEGFSEMSSERFSKVLVFLASFSFLLMAIDFVFISIKDYSPWIRTSAMIRKLQQELHSSLSGIAAGKKLLFLAFLPSYKGAHLFYEFNEFRNLIGPAFYKDDVSGKLQALTEFPEFFSMPINMLGVLLFKPEIEAVYFDLDLQRLEKISNAEFHGRNQDSVVRIFPAGESEQDHSYWIDLGKELHVDDAAQFEFLIDWTKDKSGRSARFSLNTNNKEAPGKEFLFVQVYPRKPKIIDHFHIESYALRQKVGARPVRYLYAELPKGAELISTKLVPATEVAVLEPEHSTVSLLQNGNYIPAGPDICFNLDVSAQPAASNILLEQAKPNYSFIMGGICLRDAQEYKHLASRTTISAKRAQFKIKANKLKPGFRHAFRAIGLDSMNKPCGYYSDIVYIDLRNSVVLRN